MGELRSIQSLVFLFSSVWGLLIGGWVGRRGKSGGQVRDEYRDEFDPGRGGYGRAIAEERLKEEEEYGRGR